MTRVFPLLTILILASPAGAQSPTTEYLRTNPTFLLPFREVVQKSNASVVRVQCDGKDICLGVITSADGWILTKAHDLNGAITCKMKDGRSFDAKLVGVHEEHDLAMLKIAAKSLKAIVFGTSESTRAGSWVASVGLGEDPVAVGVVSVPTRKVHEAYLGVILDPSPNGLVVQATLQNGAAMKAGLRPKDLIVRINGQSFTDPESFAHFLAGQRPGAKVALAVRRGDASLDLKATLQSRDEIGGFRAEFQNRLGSDLSTRRGGYGVILQHDSVLKPSDCGGPLVDLQGRAIGINISRAGRVESWAIPAEVVQRLLVDLKSGKLVP